MVDKDSVKMDNCCLLRKGCLDDRLTASSLYKSAVCLKYILDLLGPMGL